MPSSEHLHRLPYAGDQHVWYPPLEPVLLSTEALMTDTTPIGPSPETLHPLPANQRLVFLKNSITKAVVTKDVPPRSVVAGNPARVVREF